MDGMYERCGALKLGLHDIMSFVQGIARQDDAVRFASIETLIFFKI
jgi:hypothetical protein